jgi:fluoride exporter
MTLLLIALGGAVGSVLRYLVGGAAQHLSPRGFPIGTLAVNILGCLLIGILARLFLNMQTAGPMRAFLIVGFCGGFTTFSAFSHETAGLIQGGEYYRAAVYVLLSATLCIGATFGGMGAVRAVTGALHVR